MGILLFVLVAAAFAAGVFWLVRKNRQITEQRNLLFSVQARHAGWRFELNPAWRSADVMTSAEGGVPPRSEEEDIEFSFEGAVSGWPWRMWHDSGRRYRTGNESSMPTAAWNCDELRTPQRSLMILPRWKYRFESGRIVGAIEGAVNLFARAIAEQMGREASGDTRQAFFKRAVEIKGTLAGFDSAFVVLAAVELPGGWLDESLQALLLRWPVAGNPAGRGPAIEAQLGPDGLHLSFQNPPSQSWPFWEQFGRLGSTLAERLGPRLPHN
jgi:hypothetical protein